jgi:thiol-disulfide isomerase/thioredoxin
LGESLAFFPQAELFPRLTDAEVERFVALGKRGEDRLRAGDRDAAETAFKTQLDVYPLNSAPFVSLALLEAGRGNREAALEYLRAAVARGFRRVRELELSEVWRTNVGSTGMDDIEASVVLIERHERDWPAWDAFIAPQVPERANVIADKRTELRARIDAMSPALGPWQTRLWKRLIDRAAAAMYATYIRRNPRADDVDPALDHLLALYAGGPLEHWRRLPEDVTGPMDRTARSVLARTPEGESRPLALLATALAAYGERDRRGRLDDASVERIRAALDEIVTDYPDSSVAPVAMVGRIRVELEAGDESRAEVLWGRFDEQGSAAWTKARQQLGELTLTLGGLPSFHATTLDGSEIAPAALAGKIVVVDFWATWCAPCLDGLPALRRIDDRFGDDVVLLGINMDREEEFPRTELLEWISGREVPGLQVHDGLGWDSELVHAFGVTEIPFSVVVGPDGSVLAVDAHGKQLEKAVKTAVRSARTDTRP